MSDETTPPTEPANVPPSGTKHTHLLAIDRDTWIGALFGDIFAPSLSMSTVINAEMKRGGFAAAHLIYDDVAGTIHRREVIEPQSVPPPPSTST